MMSKAERLNRLLEENHPAAAACLSPLGRAAAFPQGIPAQAREARDCQYRATIGQITDGRGNPLPLPSMAALLPNLDPKGAFLYAPQGGIPELRTAWRDRMTRELPSAEISNPLVTLALTHGLSLVADLFADRDTEVVVPNPSWGNYKAIFRMRREANLVRWQYFDATGRLNVPAFQDALAQVETKGVVVLNFPGNPTGYTPTAEEAREMVDVLAAHRGAPLVVVCDDAYQGLYHQENVHRRSLFWDLLENPNPDRILPVKIDGATKEFAFFGGRVGFLTFGANEATGETLNDKAIAISRATVSAMPGPSQQVLLAALEHPDLEPQLEALRTEMTSRYQILHQALSRLVGTPLTPYPFNSGCFALLDVGAGLDAGHLRKRLLNEQSVGLVCIADVNALRIAYCSMAPEDIIPMVERLVSAVTSAA